MRTEVVPAGAGQVVELIRHAGYSPEGQVIQLLATPPDDEAHRLFAADAQEVADLTSRDVYIVRAAGATVAYDAGREAFAALLPEGRAARWQRLSPRAGRPAEEDWQEGPEQPPAYFGTDEHGILVPASRAQQPVTQPDPAGPDSSGPGGGLPGSAEGSGREQRQAVPAEATARADGRPFTRSPEGYTDLLHGADPARLAVDDEFTLTHEALAFESNRFSGHDHYVIDRPVARVLTQPASAIMFDSHSSFIVTGITGEEGRRVIRLRHPGEGEGEDVPPSSGGADSEMPSASLPPSRHPSRPQSSAGSSDGSSAPGPQLSRRDGRADSQPEQRSPFVLEEARSQADGRVGNRRQTWYGHVAVGLASLDPTDSLEGFAAVLPDVVPDGLSVDEEFSITRPALAYVSKESVQGGSYFGIVSPEAHDLAALAPDTSGMIMFPPSRFVVLRIDVVDDGHRVIWLLHPEEGEDVPPPSGDAHGEPSAEDAPGELGDALRRQAALAVPAALALPLSAGELGRVMGVVRGQEMAAGDGA